MAVSFSKWSSIEKENTRVPLSPSTELSSTLWTFPRICFHNLNYLFSNNYHFAFILCARAISTEAEFAKLTQSRMWKLLATMQKAQAYSFDQTKRPFRVRRVKDRKGKFFATIEPMRGRYSNQATHMIQHCEKDQEEAESNRELLQCPYCNNKVRKDRLPLHIQRVHRTARDS